MRHSIVICVLTTLIGLPSAQTASASLPRIAFSIETELPAFCERGRLMAQIDLGRGYTLLTPTSVEILAPGVKFRGSVKCTEEGSGLQLGWVQVMHDSLVSYDSRELRKVEHLPKAPLNDTIRDGRGATRFLAGMKVIVPGKEVDVAHEDQPTAKTGWVRFASAAGAGAQSADNAIPPELRGLAKIDRGAKFITYLVLADEAKQKIYVVDALRWETAASAACDIAKQTCKPLSSGVPSITRVSPYSFPLTNDVLYEPTANSVRPVYSHEKK